MQLDSRNCVACLQSNGGDHDLSPLDDAALGGCIADRVARGGLRAGPVGGARLDHPRHARLLDPELTITDPWLKLFTAGYVLVGIGILVELARRLG
jgi:hypothetical protein